MDAVSSETIKNSFSLLNDVMTEQDLHLRPSQIYNVDESGIPFHPSAPNVVSTKETKKVRYRQSGRKGQVNTVGCAIVIFDAKQLNLAWTEGSSLAQSTALVIMTGLIQICLRRGC